MGGGAVCDRDASLGVEGRKNRKGRGHQEKGWKESPRAAQLLGGRGRQTAGEWKRSLPVQVSVCVLHHIRVYMQKEEGEE